jgi:glycosyltransferase involved in cell wall biosynthesis
MSVDPLLGAVVIGRNEAQRLPACIASVGKQIGTIVFVDSGSSDGSAALARDLGCIVVELDASAGFTAARARNAGFAHLMDMQPTTQFVQFIDGDCELAAGWMALAIQNLRDVPSIAAVCGRRRERFPDFSRYNRLCDIEWNTQIGKTHSCGGDVVMRANAFAAVGGYKASLIAGEEPELCYRLRHAGWSVYRIGAEMTTHDAAISRFGQWWQRNRRNGHAIAEAFADNGRDDPGLKRTFVSNILWALPVAWPLWPLLWWRVFRRYDAQIANLMVLAKLPHFQGQVEYWMRAFSKQRTIIEYK